MNFSLHVFIHIVSVQFIHAYVILSFYFCFCSHEFSLIKVVSHEKQQSSNKDHRSDAFDDMNFSFRNRFMLPDDDRPSRSNLTVGKATRSHSDKAVQYLIVCADLPVAPHFGQIKAMRTGHSTSLSTLRKTRSKESFSGSSNLQISFLHSPCDVKTCADSPLDLQNVHRRRLGR